GARVLPPWVGRVGHHRRCRGGTGDQDPAVPAGHWSGVEGYGVRRRPRPNRRAADRRLVHGQEDQHRRTDHACHAAREDQRRLRSHAQGRVDPLGGHFLKGAASLSGAPGRKARWRLEPARPSGPLCTQEGLVIDRRQFVTVAGSLVAACVASSLREVLAASPPASEVTERLNALFDVFMDERLTKNPEQLTSLGLDKGKYAWARARLTEASL